jgi:hypothetical protein
VATNYTLLATFSAPNDGANSFFVDVDEWPGDPGAIWDAPITSGSTNANVAWRGTNASYQYQTSQWLPKVWSLTSGPHQLIVISREANTLVSGWQFVPMAGTNAPIASCRIMAFSSAGGTVTPLYTNLVAGSSQTFTASANAYYSIVGWTLDGTNAQTGGATLTLTNVQASHAVGVSFTPLDYTLTGTVTNGHGTIYPTSISDVAGAGQVFIASATDQGYAPGIWYLDGVAAQTNGYGFRLANILTNHTISVGFQSIVAQTNSSGTISITIFVRMLAP